MGEKASTTIDDMEKYIHRFYRRAWALTDLYKAAASQPTYEDANPPPKDPMLPDPNPNDQGLKTASGCECQAKSECSEHGRDFKWCLVKPPNRQKGDECPLYWNPTETDAAGNNHLLAGVRPSGTEDPAPPMWDYCRMGEPDDKSEPLQDTSVPAFAHRGCKCKMRQDLFDKYASNPAYKDKAGKFDWNRVPWSDRLGLEAMVLHFLKKDTVGGIPVQTDEETVCLRTPSSGSLHVCPAFSTSEESNNGGDPGWCGTHSWDFCVPSEPGASAAHASEQAISEQAANSAGLLQTKAAAAAAAAEQAISEQAAAGAAAAAELPQTKAAAAAAAENVTAAAAKPETASACMHPSWILAGYMARQMWIPCTHDARRHSVQRLGLAFL